MKEKELRRRESVAKSSGYVSKFGADAKSISSSSSSDNSPMDIEKYKLLTKEEK